VGLERLPSCTEELTIAIKDICNCLFALHALQYVHCDIRWANIVEVFGHWYLIDCEFACAFDELDLLRERSALTIKSSHVKDISKPWDPTYDLYQVGLLLLNDFEFIC